MAIHETLQRHAPLLGAVVRFLDQRVRGRKYVVILIDEPQSVKRQASYRANLPEHDVAVVCQMVADTARARQGAEAKPLAGGS